MTNGVRNHAEGFLTPSPSLHRQDIRSEIAFGGQRGIAAVEHRQDGTVAQRKKRRVAGLELMGVPMSLGVFKEHVPGPGQAVVMAQAHAHTGFAQSLRIAEMVPIAQHNETGRQEME